MHEEILSEQQKIILPLLSKFLNEFGLVGGTALALQIGHRRSIDFDFATTIDLNGETVKDKIREQYSIESTLIDEKNELSIAVNSVKISFFKYPFPINFEIKYKESVKMPNILTLAAMKAYALGRRAKWKDYVDLYFIFKKYSLDNLTEMSRSIFNNEFNEKLFREQLSYFNDIDYSEKIDYLEGFEVNDQVVKNTLKEISLHKSEH
ncbi:hypothetical protein A2159_03290 [Candidatus Woesebacteria bacterium RBG_13_34_9]|uniref:Nucleotidyl transferase AbiEii/AbiGii toxin family protein n=1 Tax=Candidatus Woesebacteria bacterium RBG_13_34_9 TaxID=1802477 RepID=A0A1F7WZR3_9BACT|nr:MAG: hypothetical protein A2159_03290 [Candidatus Woesebacteria bacterium RBG_13_34_9]